jgi:peroxiredoxin
MSRMKVELGRGRPVSRGTTVPAWLHGALAAAGVLSLGWGIAAVAAPSYFFERAALPLPNYPQLWQCIGVFVAIFGVGTIIASTNPLRHWPIVLMGLATKVIIPAGAVYAWINDAIPSRLVVAILANDLIWWAPLSMLLWLAARQYAAGEVPRSPLRLSPRDAMARAMSSEGASLLQLSNESPRLVVFLRHGGCTFCKEALADLRKQRRGIEASGVEIVLVHMGMPDTSDALLQRADLDAAVVVSDPLRQLYQSFELEQGSFGALFGPTVMIRGLSATLHGHVLGRIEGDGLQMPGVFVVSKGAIVRAFRHSTAADRPDYIALANGACELPSPSAA